MSKIVQEMRDNQLSQTALNFANTSKAEQSKRGLDEGAGRSVYAFQIT